MKWINAVQAFRDLSQISTPNSPHIPDQSRLDLCISLIKEEVSDELIPALARGDMLEIADGLIDGIYVLLWTGLELGLPLEDLFSEVQRSNLSKFLQADGRLYAVFNDKGKVQKGPNYSPPHLVPILTKAMNE